MKFWAIPESSRPAQTDPIYETASHERSGDAPDTSPATIAREPVLVYARSCRRVGSSTYSLNRDRQVWLLTAGLSSRSAANAVVEVNDAFRIRRSSRSASGTRMSSSRARSPPPTTSGSRNRCYSPTGRVDRLTEAIQPGRSVDASGLKAPRPRGAGLALRSAYRGRFELIATDGAIGGRGRS
jgi:hypothetical protein